MVSNNNTEYSKLTTAILRNHPHLAIEQVYKLTDNNENPLKIAVTLTSIFRNWLITKAGLEAKLPDNKIAKIAELKNPNRLYYLKDEVKYIGVQKLQNSLLVLVQLEAELKSGTDSLTNRIVEICRI